jgi:hypothetical protein
MEEEPLKAGIPTSSTEQNAPFLVQLVRTVSLSLPPQQNVLKRRKVT